MPERDVVTWRRGNYDKQEIRNLDGIISGVNANITDPNRKTYSCKIVRMVIEILSNGVDSRGGRI